MLVLGTEMHVVTFIFIVLELIMFGSQFIYYLYLPEDKNRFWYLLLLFLLIIYNTTAGLFPDPGIRIPVYIQNIIAYGSGFLTASYFPFYFYKAFDLKLLRFHAIYGVPLFLLLPFLIFFVVAYSINRNLDMAIKYGIVVPFFYSIVVLCAILRAIRVAYRVKRQHNFYVEMAVYLAVAPWTSMTLIAYFHFSQLIEAIFTNTGFIVITVMFILKSARRARAEHKQLMNITAAGTGPEVFQQNCLHYGLTRTEIRIIHHIYKGLSNKEIADKLFISEQTVKKHIQNAFRKANVNNRSALIHKLQTPHN